MRNVLRCFTHDVLDFFFVVFSWQILQTTSPFNWRLREVLAQQLPRLAPLLTPDSVFFAVVPVAFGLLNDPVAVVREKTFEVSQSSSHLAICHVAFWSSIRPTPDGL